VVLKVKPAAHPQLLPYTIKVAIHDEQTLLELQVWQFETEQLTQRFVVELKVLPAGHTQAFP